MTLAHTRDPLPVLALLLVQVLFGLNYAISKLLLTEFPPLTWGAIRMAIAAVLMFVWCRFRVPKSDRKIDSNFLYSTFLFAVFGIALNQAFFLMGLKHTTTANSAILNSMTPIFTLAFAILFKREVWTSVRGVGFLLAVCGVLVLRQVENMQISFETLQGDIYTLLNCATLAMFFTISREFFKKHSTQWATAWMFLFGAVLLSFAAVSELPDWQPVHWTSEIVWSGVYNILGATIVAYLLNAWTLTKVSSSSVALFIYLQPVIAVLNAWMVFDEPPTVRMIFAMVLIFSGVALGLLKTAYDQKREPQRQIL